ncbi:YbaK/EbsC family protein [Lentilactobacillus sp. Marseille-Q4993]|uniref:YbaK/EbsC family protein n=1 Tax=Lentilactobacillus sp. Marseille-Q4993 TaxID=3039492 RepID=UPI0024BCC62F|nr:YbaK/EbsC family protein [Lentilactobacillus sp. Marseille-Q4993]
MEFPYPKKDAKNIFVKADKKKNYYLISIDGSRRKDLNKFSYEYNTRRLAFASESALKEKLGLTPGSPTPLGLLNNELRDVVFYLDKQFT